MSNSFSKYKSSIEAILFTSADAVTLETIQNTLSDYFEEDLTKEFVRKLMIELKKFYLNSNFGFEITEIAEGFKFLTKKEMNGILLQFLQTESKKKLSTPVMETLAIIAYKQPISKPEIEQIRGVNCDYTVSKLLEKELILIKGKSDAPGRPLLYAVSAQFLDYFGLKSTSELPQLKDIVAPEQTMTITELDKNS